MHGEEVEGRVANWVTVWALPSRAEVEDGPRRKNEEAPLGVALIQGSNAAEALEAAAAADS